MKLYTDGLLGISPTDLALNTQLKLRANINDVVGVCLIPSWGDNCGDGIGYLVYGYPKFHVRNHASLIWTQFIDRYAKFPLQIIFNV